MALCLRDLWSELTAGSPKTSSGIYVMTTIACCLDSTMIDKVWVLELIELECISKEPPIRKQVGCLYLWQCAAGLLKSEVAS